MLKDGAVCRVFSNRNGIYKTPASARIYHKTRIPKVMVLAVCACPRPEYGFDDTFGMYSFTRERLAKRSDVCTGTVVGDTTVLKDVSVTAEEHRTKVIASPASSMSMREKCGGFMLMPGTRSWRPRVSECRAGSYKVASGSFLKLLGRGVKKLALSSFTSTMAQGLTLQSKIPDPSQHTAR